MTDKPFRYFDGGFIDDLYTQPQMIITDYVIPQRVFEQMENRSYWPEIQARADEMQLKIVKALVTVNEPISYEPPHTGERLQMLADIDAVERTTATRFNEAKDRLHAIIRRKTKQNMEYGLLRAIKGEN